MSLAPNVRLVLNLDQIELLEVFFFPLSPAQLPLLQSGNRSCHHSKIVAILFARPRKKRVREVPLSDSSLINKEQKLIGRARNKNTRTFPYSQQEKGEIQEKSLQIKAKVEGKRKR